MNPERFARLKQILIRTKEMPADERWAFLDQACRDDPALRAEAAALLAFGGRPDAILGTGAVLSPGSRARDKIPSLTDSAAPLRIGRYRILGKIGEGGMGVVYRAEDPALHRTVALKFVRSDIAGGDASVARFIYEARAAAALDHPNVCTVYEINDSDEQPFIAMAFVEGETLRDRIRSGPLPVDDAVYIGLQIARGLNAAHEKGIVHRDIKPSNIMLSSGGPVKIMDFGLARSGDRSELTRTGTRLGTIGYMSPEQMRGEEVDARTDVWALGVVLYEMLAGELPFRGDSDHALGYNIIHGKARRVSEVRSEVPAVLQTLIERCLKKRPADRLDAANVARLLEALRRPSGADGSVEMLRRRSKAQVLTAAGMLFLVVLAAGGLWQSRSRDGTETQLRERSLHKLTEFPDGFRSALLPGSISPNGRYLALPLRRIRGDLSLLAVVSVESGRTRHIAGPAGEVYSAGWMPDSETLLTFEYQGDLPPRARPYGDGARSQIWLRNIVLNTNQKIYEHPTYTTILWPVASPDGNWIALFRGNRQSIWIMDASGENLRKIREVPSGEWLGSPVWSPSGSRVAYPRMRNELRTAHPGKSVETCDLSGDTTVVVEEDPNLDPGLEERTLAWLPDGRLIFTRLTSPEYTTNELWSIRVDPTSGLGTGDPERFLELEDGTAIGQPTVSADGRRLAFNKWQVRNEPRLLELNAEGDSASTGRWTSQNWSAYPGAWTRDGRRIFFSVEVRSGSYDIYVADLDTGLEAPVVQSPAQEYAPCITPDESWLLFWQGDVLKRVPIDGGPSVELLRSPTPILSRWDARERVMCAAEPTGRCVLKRVKEDETTFYAFDPLDGTVHQELARITFPVTPPSGRCDLSPDGSRVAIERGNRLWILDLADGSIRELEKNWQGKPRSVSWSGDGTWLCVTGTYGEVTYWIRRVELNGNSRFLWRSNEEPVIAHARPSPDGSRVALVTGLSEADIWMLEDF